MRFALQKTHRLNVFNSVHPGSPLCIKGDTSCSYSGSSCYSGILLEKVYMLFPASNKEGCFVEPSSRSSSRVVSEGFSFIRASIAQPVSMECSHLCSVRYETAQSNRTDARGIHLTAWKQTAWAEALFSFSFLPNRTV